MTVSNRHWSRTKVRAVRIFWEIASACGYRSAKLTGKRLEKYLATCKEITDGRWYRNLDGRVACYEHVGVKGWERMEARAVYNWWLYYGELDGVCDRCREKLRSEGVWMPTPIDTTKTKETK